MNKLQEKTFLKFKSENSKRYKEIRYYCFEGYVSVFASQYLNSEGNEVAHIFSNGELKKI